MHFRKVFIFTVVLILCFTFSPCIAQVDNAFTQKTFSVEEVKADFGFFRALLEKGHPSLYRYSPQDSVQHYLDDAFAKIDHPMNELMVWEMLQPILTKIGSGHTNLHFSTDLLERFVGQKHFYLPFYLSIRNNKLFIRKYFSLGPFEIGDEVLSIDGQSSEKLIATFRNLTPGDGYSNAFKDFLLEGEQFQFFFNIIFGEKPQYTVVFKTADGVRTNVIKSIQKINRLAAGYYARKGWAFNDTKLISADTLYHNLIQPAGIPSTVVVKINSFKYDDYKSFHRKLFKYLQQNNISNLAIDLRNNLGGNEEVCEDLMSYLSDKKTKLLASCEDAIDVRKSLVLSVKGYIPAHQSQRQVYQIKMAGTKMVSPAKNNFKGKLYFFVNGGTFSAASLLVTAIKGQGNCTVIGQETGGGKSGTDGGLITKFTLPQTELVLDMPLLWGNSMIQGKNDGFGLKPDIEFIPTNEQLYQYAAKGVDPFLGELERIINQ